MPANAMLAIDLGAESGRAMFGALDGDHLSIQEIHRFPNVTMRKPRGLFWDVDHLLHESRESIRLAQALSRSSTLPLRSVGVDTWGVDYVLLDEEDMIIEQPHCYRDERNAPAFQKTIDKVGEKWLYDKTGIQFMPLNTLFQLVAQRDADARVLKRARQLLFMPDFVHFHLSGTRQSELSIASTSQMLDPYTNAWSTEVLEAAELPTHFLPSIVGPGTDYGLLQTLHVEGLDLDPSIRVIAPASHDTACAVAAVPVDPAGSDWCYLSSGTWSLLGAELRGPYISSEARVAPFTNEKGVGGTTRFLKNIAGLWLVQECKREFDSRGDLFDYAELSMMAASCESFRILVNPAYEPFAEPGNMPEKIREYARRTDQPEPESPGEFVRACLESLALSYRDTLAKLEHILGRHFGTMHIVGGGGRNQLLNRMTADATGRRVVVGPYEATSIGNMLVQAMGLGLVRDVTHLRAIVRNSFRPEVIEPTDDTPQWKDAFDRFQELCQHRF